MSAAAGLVAVVARVADDCWTVTITRAGRASPVYEASRPSPGRAFHAAVNGANLRASDVAVRWVRY